LSKTVETGNAAGIADSTVSKNSVYGHTTSNSVAPLQERLQKPDFKEKEEANPYGEGLLSDPHDVIYSPSEVKICMRSFP
jgi:hypothetical protein